MKVYIWLLLLSLHGVAQSDNVDWHIYVPAEGIKINEVYGDHNRAIIQGSTFTEFDFNDYTSFVIPDQTAVSAFALEPRSDSFAVWLSLSTATDIYLPGDIIRCENLSCESVFSPQELLNIDDSVLIDAFDLTEDVLYFSFDVGFTFNGDYIDPKGVYTLGDDGGGNSILIEQASGLDLGYSEASNLSAYDNSADGAAGISYFYGSDTNYSRLNDRVFSNEILRVNNMAPTQGFPLGISEDIKTISAFHSLNSGYVGLDGEDVDVAENAGSLVVELYRNSGSESYVQVLVESMNGTAIESVDFDFTPTAVEWFDGDSNNKSITVDIIDNQQADGIKIFHLFVFAASEFSSVFSVHEVINIRIIDDEISDLIFANGFE